MLCLFDRIKKLAYLIKRSKRFFYIQSIKKPTKSLFLLAQNLALSIKNLKYLFLLIQNKNLWKNYMLTWNVAHTIKNLKENIYTPPKQKSKKKSFITHSKTICISSTK